MNKPVCAVRLPALYLLEAVLQEQEHEGMVHNPEYQIHN